MIKIHLVSWYIFSNIFFIPDDDDKLEKWKSAVVNDIYEKIRLIDKSTPVNTSLADDSYETGFNRVAVSQNYIKPAET